MARLLNIHVVVQFGSDLKPDFMKQSFSSLERADDVFRWFVRQILDSELKTASKVVLLAGNSIIKSYECYCKTGNHELFKLKFS